jgi:hypothetical protein
VVVEGRLSFATGFPLLPALLNQLLGGAGVSQVIGRNVDDRHHLHKGEVRVPQHQDLLAAQLQLGLGSRMAALFAHVGREEPISEWRGGVEPVPAPFEP